MGRLERDLKRKVKNTKKDYSEWYSEHEQQIMRRVEETDEEIELGGIKAKRRVYMPVILGCAVILLAAIITIIVLLNNSSRIDQPGLTFSEDAVTQSYMTEEEVNGLISGYPQFEKMENVTCTKLLYSADDSLVMNIVDGELETPNDFYLINIRISYTQSFIFFDKWEFEDLENQTAINGTAIEYESKGTDDYGMYLYYAVTQTEDATLYWSVSCIEGLFDEWLQIMFG